MRWAALGAVLSAAAWALWTALATSIFLVGTGLWSRFDHPFLQWWQYLGLWGQNPAVDRWLLISNAIASGVIVLLVAGIIWRWQGDRLTVRTSRLFPRKRLSVVRGLSDNHGHADWMPPAEQRARFPGPNPEFGGIVVGECHRLDLDSKARVPFRARDRRTWAGGGKGPLLIDPCTDGPTHSLIIAGSGGFKSVAAVSTLLYWRGAAVVLDPSCELGPMLDREKRLCGQRVVHLAPGGAEGFNVLAWIDITSPLAPTNVHAVVGWAFGEQTAESKPSDEGQFFRAWGKQLAACLLAHMLWSDGLAPHAKTVRTWRAGLTLPQRQMRDVLRGIHRTSRSMMARQLAGALMEIVDETFSGVCANASGGTSWLSVPAYADMLSGRSFDPKDITRGRMTLFLQIPLKALQETPGVARMVIGSLLNQVYEADGRLSGRVLFLIDEAFLLGHMKALVTARDVGRKYGITLQLLYQSVAQLDQQWTREGRRAWYDGVSWRAYGAIQDWDTARELSDACGTYSAVAISEGDNRSTSGRSMEIGSRTSGRNESRHEIKRALILPQEITQDARTDELFVLPRSGRPIRCSRAIYFRRPELAERITPSHLAQNHERVA